jgi:DNA helicase MCM8
MLPCSLGKVTDKGMFKIYLDASFVSNSKRRDDGDVKLDQKQLYFIRQMAEEPNLISLLVNSICPGIFGHELVKGAVRLSS